MVGARRRQRFGVSLLGALLDTMLDARRSWHTERRSEQGAELQYWSYDLCMGRLSWLGWSA